jgi:hypothetical protein
LAIFTIFAIVKRIKAKQKSKYDRYCLLEDYGYSNYTVEGTKVTCLKNKHLAGSFERWYGQGKDLFFAQDCDYFTEGDAVKIDVDHEEATFYGSRSQVIKPFWQSYSDDIEILDLLEQHYEA